MKKILVGLLLALTMCFGLCGCNQPKTAPQTETAQRSKLVIVESGWMYSGSPYYIFYHEDTKVLYISQYEGGITPLYNPDGSLQIYQGK